MPVSVILLIFCTDKLFHVVGRFFYPSSVGGFTCSVLMPFPAILYLSVTYGCLGVCVIRFKS